MKLNCKNELQIKGITEIEEILDIKNEDKYLDQVKVETSSVRGLNYYDSIVFETTINFKVKNKQNKLVNLGSLASGGSYAKLCSRFKGGANFEGTGCSFGISRITYLLLQLDQLEVNEKKPIIVCTMKKEYFSYANEIANLLRKNNINTNLGKQLSFSNKKGNPAACIIGDIEFQNQTITLKNLLTQKGDNNQVTINKDDLINEIQKIISENSKINQS